MTKPAVLTLDDLVERLACLPGIVAGLAGFELNRRFSGPMVDIRVESRLARRIRCRQQAKPEFLHPISMTLSSAGGAITRAIEWP